MLVLFLGGCSAVGSALLLTWLLMGWAWVTAWPPLALLTVFLLGAVGTAVFTVSGRAQ